MQQRFVGQPFGDYSNLCDFIEHATDQHYSDLRIAVAWAKRSGLGRIWDALDAFRSAGGHVQLIIGVSEGGATKEGLELAMSGADESFVFHDPRRTFHPKVYFASSPLERSLLVGSSNLTAGGLSWNYEASLWLEWARGEDDELEASVGAWFDRLRSETHSCLPLTADLIAQLMNSSDITIGTESRARRVQRRRTDTPEDNDSAVTATINGLFGSIVTGLRRLPGLSSRLAPVAPSPSGNASEPTRQPPTDALGTAATPARRGVDDPLPVEYVVRRWFKTMDHTAAQQVRSASSNPTGNLRLSQEDADINHRTYFRDDFFGGLPWTPSEGKESEQEVVVSFHVWVDGQDLGPRDIRLSHDPRRIAGQGNVPTVLHWGPLSPILRATNYIGYVVNLERLTGGRFNLVISATPRGGFLT